MSQIDRLALWEKGQSAYRRSWSESGIYFLFGFLPSRETLLTGQTDAGSKAEKMIASTVVALMQELITRPTPVERLRKTLSRLWPWLVGILVAALAAALTGSAKNTLDAIIPSTSQLSCAVSYPFERKAANSEFTVLVLPFNNESDSKYSKQVADAIRANTGLSVLTTCKRPVLPAPQAVQSEPMQSALSQAFSEPLLAAMPQLSEKLHQGVPSSHPALYLGHEVCKSTTALGLRAALHLERVKSRYTGKERDTESGNDYFGARYYSSAMGRFMSPDWSAKIAPVPYAKLENPQTLNLYAYVLNNPLGKADADGHCPNCEIEAEEALEEAGPVLEECASGGNCGQAAKEAFNDFYNENLSGRGQQLEKAASDFTGWLKNTGRILEDEATGAKFRVPDFLQKGINILGEVKDTAKLNLTNQIKDFFAYAKDNPGMKVNFFTRNGTSFSQPLLDAIKQNGAKVFQQVDGKWVDVTKLVLQNLKK